MFTFNDTIKDNLIVIEGNECTGTSSITRELVDKLMATFSDLYIKFNGEFEPTSLPSGRAIREVLSGKTKVSNIKLANMFIDDRVIHLNKMEQIENKNTATQYFISDRYLFSSYVYQGFLNPEDIDYVCSRHKHFGIEIPKLTIHLKAETEIILSRLSERKELEIFETRNIIEKTQEGYKKVFDDYVKHIADKPAMFYEFDTSSTTVRDIIEEIYPIILSIMNPFLNPEPIVIPNII